jgi:hypothetical protein
VKKRMDGAKEEDKKPRKVRFVCGSPRKAHADTLQATEK